MEPDAPAPEAVTAATAGADPKGSDRAAELPRESVWPQAESGAEARMAQRELISPEVSLSGLSLSGLKPSGLRLQAKRCAAPLEDEQALRDRA